MKNKIRQRIFALLSIAVLIFNSVAPLFMVAYAEELTPTPEITQQITTENSPTPEPTVDQSQPTETPTPTIEPTIIISTPEDTSITSPTPTPVNDLSPPAESSATLSSTPMPAEKVCLTNEEIKDTINEDWNIDSEKGTAETKEKVKLGVKYLFPQENKVSVTFKCLPKDENLRTALKIEKVKVSDLNLPADVKPYGEYAYDITTEMTDGNFEYDITLPKPENQSAEVVYKEDINSEAKTITQENVSQEGDKVKVDNLNHFTIYIVTTSGNSPVLTTATINNQAQVTVTPNENITATIKVTTSGSNTNDDWKSSEYKIEGGSWTCVDTPDYTSDITNQAASFSFTAPSSLGTYNIEFRAYNLANCDGSGSGNPSDTVTLNDAVIVQAPTVPNPSLPASCCGLDIALVIDNSNSIDSTELSQMKTALKAFVTALSGTPTQFSVTKFGTDAYVLQGFTTDTALVNSAIDSVGTGGGGTDWQKGIIAARGTFDPRVEKPNLMIFASDGNPTFPDCGGGSTCPADVAHAVDEANIAKSAPLNIRMLALGIGGGLSTANLIAISGPTVDGADILTTDVITTDFAGMAAKLAAFASTTCGGTISVNKYIDSIAPANLATDTWTFHVAGPSSYSQDLTTSGGQANTGTVTAGTGYSITESSVLAGYTYGSASCTGATNNGTPGGMGVSGIQVGNSDIVTCNFVNTKDKGTIELKKVWLGGGGQTTLNIGTTAGGTQVVTQTTGAAGINPLTTGTKSVNTGTYYLSETGGLTDYTSALTCTDNGSPVTPGADYSIAVAKNHDVICTFTNSKNIGTVVVHKDVQGPNGEATTDTSNTFKVKLDGANEQNITDNGTVTYSNVAVGSHTITESLVTSGYSIYGIGTTAGAAGNTSGLTFTVVGGITTHVYVTNRQQNAIITIHKNVISPDGSEVSDTHAFAVKRDGDDQKTISETTNAIYTVAPGTYVFTENSDGDYTLDSITGDKDTNASNGASVTVTSGGTAELTFVNKQKKASITVVKVVKDSKGNVVDDHQKFTVQLNGANDDANLADNNNVIYNVNPGGPFAITEVSNANYDNLGCKLASGADASGITLTSNQSVSVICTNQQKAGTISGYKYKADGSTGILGWTVNLYKCVTSGTDCNTLVGTTLTNGTGYYIFNNLLTGFYQVKEALDSLYTPIGNTYHNVTINPNTASTGNNFSNFKNINITVCKKADADGSLTTTGDQTAVAGWGMKLYSDGSLVGTAQVTGADGCYTFTNLGPNHTYRVDEEIRDDWSALSDAGHTYTFGAPVDGTNQSHTFVNVQRGSITIIKDSTPNDPQNFSFTGSGPGVSTPVDLDDDSDATLSNSWNIGGTLPGTYTFTEGAVTGWDLTSLSCTGTSSYTPSIAGRNVVINLQAGENVICTFTNTKKSHLIVQKTTNPSGDQTQFSVNATSSTGGTITGGGAGAITDTMDKDYEVTPGTYSVSESGNDSWDITGNTCNSVVVGAGETKYCEITNTQRGSIKIIKDSNPNDSQDFSFTGSGPRVNTTLNLDDDDDSTLPNYWLIQGLASGNYNFSEGAVSGWDLTDISCTGGSNVTKNVNSRNVSINLNPGETVTCTFTNSKNPRLTVIKHVINDNGGAKTAQDFTMKITGTALPNPTSFVGSETGTAVSFTSLPGNYDVDEDAVTGYIKSIGANCSGTMNWGDDKTCTITNNDAAPSLTLNKILVKDNGGTANESAWTLTANGGTLGTLTGPGAAESADVVSGAAFKAGTYTLSESTGPSGYTASAWTCTNEVIVNGSNQITLTNGQNTVCSITNDDIQPKLTVTKVVVGDSTPVSAFPLKVDTTIVTSGTQNGFNAGAHIVSEYDASGGNFPNYNKVISGNCASNGSVTLAPGDVKSCTITNTRKTGTLRILKNVDLNGDGNYVGADEIGATNWQWQTRWTGDLPEYAHSGNTGDLAISAVTGNHYISETAKPNFHQVSISCTGDNYEDNTPSGHVVGIGENANVVCTFVNARDTGTVELKKIWSGTAGQTTLKIGTTAGGSEVDSQLTGSNGGASLTTGQNSVITNTYYLSETGGLSDYTSSPLSCYNDVNNNGANDSEPAVTVGASNSVSVAKDQHVVCAFTNTRKTATLKLVKTVDYGPAQPAEWTLTATGTNGFSDNGNSTTFHTINANSPYALSESSISGWSQFGSWSCNMGSLSGSTITLSADQNATCTVTNHRDMGSVKINKKTDINGDGDWTDSNDEGNNQTNANNWANTNGFRWLVDGVNYTFGTTVNNLATNLFNYWHNFNETIPAGYHFVGWYKNAETGRSCTSLNGTTLPINNGEIQITKNNTTEITYCNARDMGRLKIIKSVNPDDSQDFDFSGTNGIASFILDDDGNNGNTYKNYKELTLKTGAYQITEGPETGWSLDDINCVTEGQWGDTGSTLTVDVEKDKEAVCTFTNKRDTGTIIITKNSINDSEDNFYFDSNFPSGNFELEDDGTSGNGETVETRTFTIPTGAYWTDERDRDGWKLTNIVCTGDDHGNINIGTGKVDFDLDKNETISCTYTNTKLGSITLAKDTNPDQGGDEDHRTHFDYSGSLGDGSLYDEDTDTFSNKLPGSYTITEAQENGWYLNSIVCNPEASVNVSVPSRSVTITLRPGENVTCKFVNDQKGKIEAKKFEDDNANGSKDSGESWLEDWDMKLYNGFNCSGSSIDDEDTNHDGIATFYNLMPGSYSVKEVLKSGWEQTAGGVCQNVTIGVGETKSATFGNFRLGSISGHKYNDKNGDGNRDGGENYLRDWKIYLDTNDNGRFDAGEPYDMTDNNGVYSFDNLHHGNYTVREVLQSGWEQTDPSNGHYHITLNSGDNHNGKDFGNRELGSIKVCKIIIDPARNVVNGTDVPNSNFTINWDRGLAQTQFTSGYTFTDDLLSNVPGDDAVCTIYNNLPQNAYHYSQEGLPSGWETPRYNDQYNTSVNDIDDFYTYGQNTNSNGEINLALPESGKDRTLVILNQYKKGSITGYKWNDINSNRERDCISNESRGELFETNFLQACQAEPNLSGWTINLYNEADGGLGQIIDTDVTDTNGNYSFEATPGNYWICEELKNGWEQTYPNFDSRYPGCYQITLGSDEDLTNRNFGNHNLIPSLTISKANNAIGTKAPGNVIGYTITISNDANAGDANNVLVTDLLPKGFMFNLGSWKVVSNDITRGAGGDISSLLTAPSYNSPGTWTLGALKTGETLTLTYTATIDGEQQTGTYYDNAWGQGNPVSDSASIIFAKAINPGDLDPMVDPSEFVGTDVIIANDGYGGPERKSTTTQEVLGASTSIELPSTGEDTLWVIIATLTLALGSGVLVTGLKLKKKYE